MFTLRLYASANTKKNEYNHYIHYLSETLNDGHPFLFFEA